MIGFGTNRQMQPRGGVKMSTPLNPVRLQIPVSRLAILPAVLIRGLGELGIGGARMEEVFTRRLELECVGCGLRLTMGELMNLDGVTEADPNYAKLRRVRLGSCGRNTCTSQFYVLQLSLEVGMDGDQLRQRLSEWIQDPSKLDVATPVEGEAGRVRAPGQRVSGVNYHRKLLWRILGMVGAGVALLVTWYWWQAGAYIPGISREPQVFMPVEDAGAGVNRAPSAPTPRPERVFQVK